MPQQNNQFVLSCPACYSPDHVAYGLHIMDDFYLEPYGEDMRHCAGCGLKFMATSGVELRELKPVEPPAWLRMDEA